MPKTIDQEILTPLFHAVGSLVINWTYLESSLDYCAIIIYHNAGGKHEEKELPVKISRKTEFLRKCFKRIGVLAPFATEGIKIIEKIDRLKNIRDFVVHGTFTNYQPEGHVLTFTRLDLPKPRTMHHENQMELRASILANASNDLADLTGRSLNLANNLLKALVPEDERDELKGRLGG